MEKYRIKRLIKKVVDRISDSIYYRLGYSKSNNLHEKNSLLSNLFTTMRYMGFEPKHIIDVGANHGTWTREILRYAPNAYYTLIEPQNWLKSSFQDLLENNRIIYYPAGAGKTAGSFKFTIVDRDDSCSFRYSEEEAQTNGFKQLEIPVKTLNEIVIENQDKPFPDLVKIDAEGLDLDVLDGASDLFGKTEVFMVEAAVFSKCFDNTIQKMINYMADRDYVLFDITDLNRPFEPKVLWLMELVFVKKDGKINRYEIK